MSVGFKGRKNDIAPVIIILALAILTSLVGGSWYAKQRGFYSQVLKNLRIESGEGNKNEELATYDNPIMGISFSYPKKWRMMEGLQDPNTQGDILKDGKIYTSFSTALLPPDWGKQNVRAISIDHTLLNYDSLGQAAQLEKVRCKKDTYVENDMDGPVIVHCSEYTNNNGVVMIRENYETNFFQALVPTGKYIIAFGFRVEDLKKDSERVKIFEKILDSLKFSNQTNISNWKTYRNEEFGLEFKYPAAWRLEPPNAFSNKGYLLGKVRGRGDVGGEQVDFEVSRLGGLTLQQWMSKNVGGEGTDSSMTLAGTVGIRRAAVGDISGEPTVMILLAKNELVYVFSTVGEENIKTLDRILSTLNLFLIQTSGRVTYRNEKYGFQFEYPAYWFILQTEGVIQLWGKESYHTVTKVLGEGIPNLSVEVIENMTKADFASWYKAKEPFVSKEYPPVPFVTETGWHGFFVKDPGMAECCEYAYIPNKDGSIFVSLLADSFDSLKHPTQRKILESFDFK